MSAEELQEQMRHVRANLGIEVHRLVENARVMTDWRHYVRKHPWACLGAAAALGYCLIPARAREIRPDAEKLAALASSGKLHVNADARSGLNDALVSSLLRFAASAVIRRAVALMLGGRTAEAGGAPPEAAGPSSAED